MLNWMETAKVDTDRSYLEAICWPYDRHPGMAQLLAGSQIIMLEADGPGVVTNIHSSRMDFLDDILFTKSACEADAYRRIIIEITYDHNDTPDICMPLCEFLADIDGECSQFRSVYFSKVAYSHNFRLPIPFREHIRIVLKNPTKTDLISYTDTQWKKLPSLPEDIGYLKIAYFNKILQIPEETAQLCYIQGPGTVRAQWMSLGTDLDLAWNGEYICEGNQLFFIDGEEEPSIEYCGNEDVYSHSWGFGDSCGGDLYAVITRMDHPTDTRTEISMLRCRTLDSIGFSESLRLMLDYRFDFYAKDSTNPIHNKGVFAQRKRVSYPLHVRNCIYYYTSKNTCI